MKRIPWRFLLLLGAAFALIWSSSGRRSGPKVGSEAAAFDLPLVSADGTFSLQGARGKPVLVEAFASWCGACRSAAPMLADAARAERAREVQFLAVSLDDSRADAERAASGWGIPYPVALDDGTFARAYGIRLLPTLVLVDAEGRIRHVSSGSVSASELEEWLSDVGAERR